VERKHPAASCRVRGCPWYGRACPDPEHSEPAGGPFVPPGATIEFRCRECGTIATRQVWCCRQLTEAVWDDGTTA